MGSYLRKNWKKSALVCLLQIVEWGFQAGVQLLLMQVFDKALSLDLKAFLFWSAVDMAAWGGYFLVCYLRESAQARVVRALNNDLRHDLCRQLLQKGYQDYHQQDSGEYLSWMTNDVKQIEQLAWNPFFNCVGRVAQVAWSMLVLLSLHWSLLAASLVSALIMWALPKLFEEKLERLGRLCSERQAAGVSALKDLISGLDVLRFFGQRDRFLHKGQQASDQIEQPACQLASKKSAADSAMGCVSVLLQTCSDLVIVLLAINGQLMMGTLAGGSNLIAGVTNGLHNIANLRMSLAAGRPYFEKLVTEQKETGDEKPLPPLHDAIRMEGISFAYGEKPILRRQDFVFSISKKYALTGPSGCGKSTLFKILLGWLPGYEGKIWLDNIDARDCTAEQLQQQMSYIEQDVFLFNTTIRENITLGEEFSPEQMERALRDSALLGDLARMPQGLDTVVGEGGSALSGGQKQRVAIARALIHNRSILLVDEGTSALDRENAELVEQSLLQNPDLTLILISHHLSGERERQFDQVYRMQPCQQAGTR